MMLDNKNEQKWPLTENSSKEQISQGSFLLSGDKKEGAEKAAPTDSAYHTRNAMSTFALRKKWNSYCCIKNTELFWMILRLATGKKMWYSLDTKIPPHKEDLKGKSFPKIFRLYKLKHQQNECSGGVQISSVERFAPSSYRKRGNQWC